MGELKDEAIYAHKSEIRRFYRHKSILITGATGFLGKVLLWKLLKSCPETGTIYVSLRSKNDQSAGSRLMEVLEKVPFAPTFSYDDIRDKVVAIESDITCPSLGLSDRDRDTLTSTVNVVFHCAASVKFDAPLKDNIRDNVIGTQGIIELCKQIKQLNTFIHVSTAYSNCHLKDINEDLHELKRDPDDVIQLISESSGGMCDKLTKEIIEGRPNTYTYTKAMAEHLVAREQDTIPVGIVRPSIVTSSFQEPVPGWVDNVNGLMGLSILASLGILRSIDWNYWAVSDVVPVDYVANCIIVAGRAVSAGWQAKVAPHKLLIYNMASGEANPISWGRFFDLTRAAVVEAPTNMIARPMICAPRHKRANRITNWFINIFSELLFAHVVDTLIGLFGYKKIMVKITKKLHHAYDILRPFTAGEWTFKSANLMKLARSMSLEDQREFNFDMKTIDWNDYTTKFWLGLRELMLKEPNTPQSKSSAKRRMHLVGIIHNIGLALLVSSLTYVLYCLTSFTLSKFIRI